MNFVVTSRRGIEQGVPVQSEYVVISIHDPQKKPARIRSQPGLRASLVLAFNDVAPLPIFGMPEGFILMSQEQARQIREFFEQHRTSVETVVVHCEMWISRSAAVAAALCRVLGGDDVSFWREYDPNRFVYERVLQAFGIGTGAS